MLYIIYLVLIIYYLCLLSKIVPYILLNLPTFWIITVFVIILELSLGQLLSCAHILYISLYSLSFLFLSVTSVFRMVATPLHTSIMRVYSGSLKVFWTYGSTPAPKGFLLSREVQPGRYPSYYWIYVYYITKLDILN